MNGVCAHSEKELEQAPDVLYAEVGYKTGEVYAKMKRRLYAGGIVD